jgi:hypothetical protein
LTVIAQQKERTLSLEEELQAALARYEIRRQVLDRLLAGQLTLRQAAESFGKLNDQLPAGARMAFRVNFPGDTDEERCYHQVIAAAEYRFLQQPRMAAAVRACLTEELQAIREASSFGKPS